MSQDEIEDINDLNEELQEDDNDDSSGESLENNYDQQYAAPKDADKFIDTQKGNIINREDLTHFDVIRALSQKTGIKINEPNTSCRKCYGKGYVGIDVETTSPIPCLCIYPKEELKKLNEQPQYRINRATKRHIELMSKKLAKKNKKIAIEKQKRENSVV